MPHITDNNFYQKPTLQNIAVNKLQTGDSAFIHGIVTEIKENTSCYSICFAGSKWVQYGLNESIYVYK